MPPLGRRTADSTRSHRVIGKFSIVDFVFPNSDHFPTGSLQIVIISSIAIHVALEFGRPVIVVAGWHRGVFRATMPKASVDEDRDTFGGKDDIDFDAPRFELDVTIFSEA